MPHARPWPTGLPFQTHLQEGIHADTWDLRLGTVTILHHSGAETLQTRANRMSLCGAQARFYIDPETWTVRPWLQRCGDRLCPFCARHRVRRVANNIALAIATMSSPRTIVLTMQDSQLPLVERLLALRVAFTKLRRSALWRTAVRSGVYVTEITRNLSAGTWHPHLHIVYDGEYIPQRRLSTEWQRATGTAYVVWIAAVKNIPRIANELAKYVAKAPRQKDLPPADLCEYALATHGLRMVQPFGKRLPLAADDADNNSPPTDGPPPIGWGRILFLANSGDAGALDAVILIIRLWPTFRQAAYATLPQLRPPDSDGCRGPPRLPPPLTDEDRELLNAELAPLLMARAPGDPPCPS